MLYDCEGSGSPDAGLHHSRAIPGVKARGYRLFWGEGTEHDPEGSDTEVSPSQANAIITAAQTSQAAMVAAMPSSWQSYFNGLSNGRQSDIYEEIKAHPAVS